jgi:superfamily I DNA/RNA helicase/RecB family exonuclease
MVFETRVDPDDWADHVAPIGRPQIVVGGPGTGKTEFLCRRIAAAVAEGSAPAAIAVLTFSRLSVNDIRTRLFASLGSSSYQVQVSTYHSLANRLVEAHHESIGWNAAPTVLAGPEHERLVSEVLMSEEPANWMPMYRGILQSRAMASELTDFILRFHEQGGNVADIERSEVPEWAGIGAFIQRYHDALKVQDRIDYGKLLVDAVRILETNASICASYDHVLADEYQDTSPIQAQLLFALARNSGSLTVAADPYQSIYSFRGTDLHNVLDFPAKATAALAAESDRLVLTTSFRVPEEILSAAVSVTGRELPGAAGKVASVRERGTVDTHVFDNPDSESEWIGADIERVHLADGVPLHRIAIFTRSTGDFQTRLATSLERRDIAHSLTVEQLEDQPVVRFIYDLVSAAAAGPEDDISDVIRSVLLGPFVAAPPGTVNEVIRRVDRGETWSGAISDAVPRARELAVLIEDSAWAARLPAQDGLWEVWTRLETLRVIATDDARVADRRAWSAFAQVVTRLGERSERATLLDQQILSAASDIEADALFNFRSGPVQGVTIGTLHRSKGTEFDVVYIANAVEGQLPDLRSKDSLLRTRLLNPRLPEDPLEYVQFRLNEERRLAYTAMTRATDRVVWTATELDSPSQQLEPSRFLSQVAEPVKAAMFDRPLTHRGYEALLRRRLNDKDAADLDRLAALVVLGNATQFGFADQAFRYGTVAGGLDTGFVEPDHVTSPSQANTYDECPRRYALERFATKKDPESVYLQFGNLVHKVLEVVEGNALSQKRPRSTFEEALCVLEDLWDEFGFGTDAIGDAWMRRTTGVLEVLYSKWPTSAEPVSLEREFSTELDETKWRGKADRIEAAAGNLTVVDYKTSKSAMTVQDAATSLQLGYYVLAAMSDPEVAEFGAVTGASFWYPSAPPRKDAISTRDFDMDNLEAVRDRLVEIARAIQAEDFEPKVNKNCDRCDFLSVCPAQKEGREAFAS